MLVATAAHCAHHHGGATAAHCAHHHSGATVLAATALTALTAEARHGLDDCHSLNGTHHQKTRQSGGRQCAREGL